MQAKSFLLSLVIMVFFAGCSRQQMMSVATPLFINFPVSAHVFDNITPVLYEAVHQQLMHSGFAIADQPQHAYRLVITIKSLDPVQKNISPDIVLLSYKMSMGYTIQVLNYANKVVFNHDNSCAILISKPRNPMLNDTFIHYTYQTLANRVARLIQQQLITNIKHIFGS